MNSKPLWMLLAFSLLLHSTTHLAASETPERVIGTRIDEGLQWLLTLKGSVDEKDYFLVASSQDGMVNVAHSALTTATFVMYAKTYTSDKYDSLIRSSLEFILSMQNTTRGDFAPFYHPSTKSRVEYGEMYYLNSYILASLAFSAFHMRMARSSPSDVDYYATVISSIQICFDNLHPTHQGSDGSWRYLYSGDRYVAEIDTNGMTLTALLYTATYLTLWGDRSQADRYIDWAEKTKDWILSMQEDAVGSWGYGGFYQNGEKSLQSAVSNARAIFGLTTYLRLIDSLVDRQTILPSLGTVRSSLVLWEDGFFKKMVDRFNGPFSTRDSEGGEEYPKSTKAAACSMIAFVEIWVVHGDSKFLNHAKALYSWLIGNNEGGSDLQMDVRLEGRGFVNGFSSTGVLDEGVDLESNAQSISALLYGNWIDIPEFPSSKSITFVLTVCLSLILLSRRIRRRD